MRIGEAVWATDESDHALRTKQVSVLRNNRGELVAMAFKFQTYKHGKPGEPLPPLIVPVDRDVSVCPVAMVANYLVIRVGGAEYMFTHGDGEVVTAAQVLRALRLALDFIGLDSSRFGGHSFWIGRCTELIEEGRNATEVKAIGRWQSHAVDLYHKPNWLIS